MYKNYFYLCVHTDHPLLTSHLPHHAQGQWMLSVFWSKAAAQGRFQVSLLLENSLRKTVLIALICVTAGQIAALK